jgi:hypothetical protein
MRTLPTIWTGFEALGTLDLRGVAEVPVPPTLPLLLVGLAGLAVLRCRVRAGRQGPDVGWRMALGLASSGTPHLSTCRPVA